MNPCHSAQLEMNGVAIDSATSPEGLTVGGVQEAKMRSTLLFRIMSAVTCAARFESDWVSVRRTWTGCFILSPKTMPSPIASSKCFCAHLAPDEKEASGPVTGTM